MSVEQGRGTEERAGLRGLRRVLSDIAGCLRFFSCLPVPRLPWEHGDHLLPDFRTMPRMLPVAGAIIGCFGAIVFMVATALGLGPWIAAALAVTALVLVTGGLHEDGLADTADGFGGGATIERRLEIMRDSRVGAFGAMAIALSLVLRILLLGTLGERVPTLAAAAALVMAASVSRTASLAVMTILPPARTTGASHAVGRPGGTTLATAGAIAALIGLSASLGAGLPLHGAALAFLLAVLAALGNARLSKRLIGGQTGDVIGAAQQLAEIAALLGLLVAVRA